MSFSVCLSNRVVGRVCHGSAALLWSVVISHSLRGPGDENKVSLRLLSPFITLDKLSWTESSWATGLCAKPEWTRVRANGANRAEVGPTDQLNSLVGAQRGAPRWRPGWQNNAFPDKPVLAL